MNAELTKQNDFKNIINNSSFRNQIRASLKENAGGFIASMLDLYSNSKDLQKCNPNEVASECLKAASLNLPIVKTLGFAYVVPYKNKPTFTIGYKGLIQLAQRTGQYKTINADVIYEGELKERNKLKGYIDLSGEIISENVTGYFAHIELISGFEKTLYMSKKEVEGWGRKYSPSYHSNFSPWKSEFDKMALKTVLRRLISTYGAMTTELYKALETDDKGSTPKQEIEDYANKEEIIDISDYQEMEEEQTENLKQKELNIDAGF